MKMIVACSLLFFGSLVSAAVVKSAKLDSKHQNILIDVNYVGGCGDEPQFTLKLGVCRANDTVHCLAQLVQSSELICDKLVAKTVAIPLAQYGLDSLQFQGADLTIFGDKDWLINQPSQVTVQLP